MARHDLARRVAWLFAAGVLALGALDAALHPGPAAHNAVGTTPSASGTDRARTNPSSPGVTDHPARIAPESGYPGTPSNTSPGTPSRVAPASSTRAGHASAGHTGRGPGLSRTGSGPGLSRTGIDLVASADSDGTLEIIERVRLPRAASRLTLSAPVAHGRTLRAAQPRIAALQAQSESGPVTAPDAPLADGRWVLDLPGPSRVLWLRYQLRGADVRTNPSPIGRVLVLLGPAAAPDLPHVPVMVHVVGSGVRNLVCPSMPATRSVCGVQHGLTWTAGPQPASASTVVA